MFFGVRTPFAPCRSCLIAKRMKTFLLNAALHSGETSNTDPAAGLLIMKRAIELASIDGRSAIELSKTDWEQAKRELEVEE